ncbi:MAG: DUF1599 domain-containing protein [Bacteroidota bacterium]
MCNTSKQYDEIIFTCKDLFIRKLKDYGSSWRIMRPSSVTDQIFIKAQRIRSIEDKKVQLIDDDVKSEFIGIVNYSIIALIQLQLNDYSQPELKVEEAEKLYVKYATEAKELMEAKNHDYGEAWREMRVSSLTDIILMRIFRIKQIEDNQGKTEVSEGIDSNYLDMMNYAIFSLIKLTF